MTQANIERLSQLSEELKEIADLMKIVIYFRRYQEGKRRLRELIPKLEEVKRKEKGQNNKALAELIGELKRRAR